MPYIERYLQSTSSHQVFLAAVIVEEWAKDHSEVKQETQAPFDAGIAKPLTDILLARIESPSPSTYYEMDVNLQRIFKECQALLNAFAVEAKVSKGKIPTLSPTDFSIGTAQEVTTTKFDTLARLLSSQMSKSALPSLKDRQRKVMGSIGYFSVMKERYDVTVSAGIAGALIAMKQMPSRIGPVIKAVMDSVRVSYQLLLCAS